MVAKKARKKITKPPSPAQIRARKAFAAAAKARARAAKKKHATIPKRRNKTIITKPKKVTVINRLANGESVRRKYRNGYLDLVIAGTARRGAKGWRVGGKQIPYGKGIVSVSAGHFLDKGTGQIFKRVERNAAGFMQDGVFHPIRSGTEYRYSTKGGTRKLKGQKFSAKPYKPSLVGEKHAYSTKEAAKYAVESRGFKAKITGPASRRLIRPSKSRGQRNPSPADNRREFAGHYTGNKKLRFPDGTPSGLSKCGTLKLIKLRNGSVLKPGVGTTWLCRDQKQKLHLGTTRLDGMIYDGPAGSMGEIDEIEYDEIKNHLYPNSGKIRFYHKLGEENGIRPTLVSDGKGGLKFRGGDYKIEARGIVN